MEHHYERLQRRKSLAALVLCAAVAAPSQAGAQVSVDVGEPGGAPLAAEANQCLPSPPAKAGLARVGPLRSTGDSYPTWYEDTNGVRLELCMNPTDPFCALPPDSIPDPTRDASWPDNFPDEAFYTLAEATMTTNAGNALIVLGLEAAWAAEIVRPGDAIVFGRVRHRVDLATAGSYRITHPYGVDVFTVDAGGRRAINHTEDVGVAAMDFTQAMKSRIGPFLTWDPAVPPLAPPGYVGDPNTPHPVVGSALPEGAPPSQRQNYYRIESVRQLADGTWVPDPTNVIGNGAFPCPDRPNDRSCIQTNLFTLTGKVARINGVEVERASYRRDLEGKVTLAVHATSTRGQALTLTVPGRPDAVLRGEGTDYFANLELGALPAEIEVTNRSDPAGATDARKKLAPVDEVTISYAVYDATARTLTIGADSSDLFAAKENPPLLSAFAGGCNRPLVDGVLVVPELDSPPATVTVRSRMGGSDTARVEVLGGSPLLADAGADLVDVQQGTVVTLDGSRSAGPIESVQWTAPPGITLTQANTLMPSFVVPTVSEPTTLRFTLTIRSIDGVAQEDTVSVSIRYEAPPVVVIEAPTQTTVAPGSAVTLRGKATGTVTRVWWEQISGSPIVALAGNDPAVQTFTFPTAGTALVFRFSAEGPGGTVSENVVVAPSDAVQITQTNFRNNRFQWDIAGTAVLTSGSTVTITLDGNVVLGTAPIDPFGAWSFRLRDAPPNKRPTANSIVTAETTAGAKHSLGVTIQ